jgi:acetyltransferase-like isoleucine patch superfamily enzyme
VVGNNVGIGPGVKILTSAHDVEDTSHPILHNPIRFAQVVVEDDSDIGANTVLLPGVHVGRGAQIGAGAVVTADVAPYSIVAGGPARFVRHRGCPAAHAT